MAQVSHNNGVAVKTSLKINLARSKRILDFKIFFNWNSTRNALCYYFGKKNFKNIVDFVNECQQK